MPKLDVSRATYLSAAEEAKFRESLNLSKTAAREVLSKLGIDDVRPPTTGDEDQRGPTPVNIETLDSMPNQELGALYTEYIGWAQYLRVESAKAKANYLSSKAVLRRVGIHLKARLLERGFAKEQVAQEVLEVPFYEEVAIEVDRRQISAELLDAYRAAFSNTADALSRIITLRGQEFDSEKRASSYGNYRKSGSSLSALRRAGAKSVKAAADD